MLTPLQEARRQYWDLKERGFKALKLHVWGDPKKDIAASRAVKEAVGEDMVLIFDAAMAYHHEEALWVGRQLEEMGCYFYESPLRDYDLRGLKELADQPDIPIAVAEEGSGSYFASAQFIDQRAGDIIRGDVSLKGGITALVKLAHLCEAFGIMCEIHVGTNPFADMANLHVMCAIKNCAY